jgi:hypothetical protein
MELRTTLAKLLWKYDMQLMDDALDWHRDSQMHTLWKKPKLLVELREKAAEHGNRAVGGACGL